MAENIRVMIVDDSTTVRSLVKAVFDDIDHCEVVALAENGRDALNQFAATKPDVVLLDVEMPEMDGIETTTALRSVDATVAIVMFSALTSKGAEATMDALAAGANDYVLKPTCGNSREEVSRRLNEELVPTVLGLGRETYRRREKRSQSLSSYTTNTRTSQPKVIGIASSIGGPNALSAILSQVSGPQSIPPILVAQHMPAVFTGIMAERLNQDCDLAVVEAEDGAAVQNNHVYIAPGDQHMTVYDNGLGGRIKLSNDNAELPNRPSADVLLKSIADTYGKSSLAIILTGMGRDGLLGCSKLHDAGGRIIAQDEASCVVWGMAGAVVDAGLANAVLTIEQIAREISQETSQPQPAEVNHAEVNHAIVG